MSTRIRTVIVDDDVPTRIGIATILASDPDVDVVGEADNGRDAVALVEQIAPDVAIVDVRLPGMDGIEVTRRIVALGASRVIVLTTFALDDLAYRSMKAGASAFLLKRLPAEDLIRAVHAVAGGDELAIPDLTTELISGSTDVSDARTDVFNPPLTTREAEVLLSLAVGLSNDEIAQRLHVSIETVRTHVKHIYMKCGVRDRAHAVIAAYESGMVGRARR
jgi:DNA-binding NarL/FixJ family response regulator